MGRNKIRWSKCEGWAGFISNARLWQRRALRCTKRGSFYKKWGWARGEPQKKG